MAVPCSEGSIWKRLGTALVTMFFYFMIFKYHNLFRQINPVNASQMIRIFLLKTFIMKLSYFVLILILFSIGCTNRKDRISASDSEEGSTDKKVETSVPKPKQQNMKISKAVFYLENSGSMFGYVKGFTEYVDVVSGLAYHNKFSEQKTPRQFYFVNGGENLKITNIGTDPSDLNDKLNLNGYNCGDPSKSNLNSMFQLALAKAKQDTICILISDGIYDLGKPQAPMNALSTEGNETKEKFINRLSDGDLETIIIKLNSHFDGNYFPVTGGSVKLSQDRPYYVFIFGDTKLLNKYFSDEYIKSLKGYSDIARFLKWNEFSIPYQITNKEKKGNFRFDNKNKNKLIRANPVHDNFQFAFAVDFSELPFSNDFCLSQNNYKCNIDNYIVDDIVSLNEDKIPGIDFDATHLITLLSNGNPYGKISLSLNYRNPSWIQETNIDEENGIVDDTAHTFGFKFLTEAITEAYDYKNETKTIVDFNFEITKN